MRNLKCLIFVVFGIFGVTDVLRIFELFRVVSNRVKDDHNIMVLYDDIRF